MSEVSYEDMALAAPFVICYARIRIMLVSRAFYTTAVPKQQRFSSRGSVRPVISLILLRNKTHLTQDLA